MLEMARTLDGNKNISDKENVSDDQKMSTTTRNKHSYNAASISIVETRTDLLVATPFRSWPYFSQVQLQRSAASISIIEKLFGCTLLTRPVTRTNQLASFLISVLATTFRKPPCSTRLGICTQQSMKRMRCSSLHVTNLGSLC